MKNLILSLLAAATLIGVASSVEAHTKCKVNLGFGNWTEGCPGHSHPQKRQQRHYPSRGPNGSLGHPNAGGTRDSGGYKFRVYNYDQRIKTVYYYRGRRYPLGPGQSRLHSSSSKYVTVIFDDIANNGKFDRWSKRFNADTHDIRVRYKGAYLRYKLTKD